MKLPPGNAALVAALGKLDAALAAMLARDGEDLKSVAIVVMGTAATRVLTSGCQCPACLSERQRALVEFATDNHATGCDLAQDKARH